MSKYKYITGQNIKQLTGKTVEHIKTKEQYTVVRIQGSFITLSNKYGIPDIITPQYLKHQFVVLEEAV